jgi:hypothetical protein
VAPDLPDAARAQLGAMWAFRACGEHETAAHYEDLAGRLRAGGPPGDFAERVSAAAADEARHRDLCAGQAAQFGHAPPDLSSPRLPRIAPHPLTGGARLAYEMVALFCVTESINATLLLRSWQQASDDATRGALHALLADEVQHSRIGWGYLAAERGWRDDIASGLPRMLAAATHDENFLAGPPADPVELSAYGLLPQSALRAVFLEAMHDVVLPGLDLCGVDTCAARAWLTTCTSRWGSGAAAP